MSTYGLDVDVARSLDSAHRAIHDGNAFTFQEVLSLGSAEIGSYILTAPSTNKQVHLSLFAQGTFGFTFDLYKGSDATAGTAATPYNRNGNSATSPGLGLSKTATGGTTQGTKIGAGERGSATVAGVLDEGSYNGCEWVLDEGTKYVLKLTSSAAANKVSVRLNWYEATP